MDFDKSRIRSSSVYTGFFDHHFWWCRRRHVFVHANYIWIWKYWISNTISETIFCCICNCWDKSQVKLSDLSRGTRPWNSLVVDEVVKKPNKPNQVVVAVAFVALNMHPLLSVQVIVDGQGFYCRSWARAMLFSPLPPPPPPPVSLQENAATYSLAPKGNKKHVMYY